MYARSQTALESIHVLLSTLSYFLSFLAKGGNPKKQAYLAPDPLAVRGMLRHRDHLSAAKDVTLDEAQESDFYDLLAVCLKMDLRGQLKACREERQCYSVYVEGSPMAPNGPQTLSIDATHSECH